MEEVLRNKALLYFLYMNKLQEFGLLSVGGFVLEPKGFDVAIDSYNSGLKLTNEEIEMFLNAEKDLTDSHKKGLLILLTQLQSLGFDEAKKRVYLGKKPSIIWWYLWAGFLSGTVVFLTIETIKLILK